MSDPPVLKLKKSLPSTDLVLKERCFSGWLQYRSVMMACKSVCSVKFT